MSEKEKFRTLWSRFSAMPKADSVDIRKLAGKVNLIRDPTLTNIMIEVMRQDPNYTEAFFTEENGGTKFNLKNLCKSQIHVMSKLVDALCK